MTDLEQRIREAYDAQPASEPLRGRTLALLEEERKRRPDAPSVEVHRALSLIHICTGPGVRTAIIANEKPKPRSTRLP